MLSRCAILFVAVPTSSDIGGLRRVPSSSQNSMAVELRLDAAFAPVLIPSLWYTWMLQ